MKTSHLDLVNRFFKRTCTLAVLVAFGTCAAQTSRWDMPNEYGPQTVPGMADARFSEQVKRATNGRLEIINQFGGAINVKSRDMLDAVSTGALMLAHFPIQAASGTDPLMLVSNLPAIAQTPEESIVLQDVIRPHLDRLFTRFDAQILYMTYFPPVGVWSKAPLTTLESYKGRKLRTNDAISSEFFRRLGASTFQISWVDLLPQIQTGAVDSVHTSTSGGILGQLWQTLPIYNDIGTALSINVAIVNRNAMNKLDPQTREAIMEAGRQTEAWARRRMMETIETEKKTIIASGGKILGLSEMSRPLTDAMSAAGRPVLEDWLKRTGTTGRQILDEFAKRTNKKF